jgi:hypothetical protein
MENLSLSLSDILEVVTPIIIALIKGCYKEAHIGSYRLCWDHHFENPPPVAIDG